MARIPTMRMDLEFRGKTFQDAARGFDEVMRSFSKSWDGTPKIISEELKSHLKGVAKALAEKHGQPYPGGTTDETLSLRSGMLTRSIVRSVRVRGNTVDTVEGQIGVTGRGAIHETGGTVTPKKAKFLAIPLPAALDANGVPKAPSPRQWANTFVARSKKGNLLVFQKRASMVVPLYVLKESVTLPPRLGMQAALKDSAPYFMARLADRVVAEIEKARGA